MLKNTTNIPCQRVYHTSSVLRERSVSSCGEEMHHTLENCLGKNLNGNKYKCNVSIMLKFQIGFIKLCSSILTEWLLYANRDQLHHQKKQKTKNLVLKIRVRILKY